MNLQLVLQHAHHGPKRGQPIWMVYDFDVADDRASRLFPNGYRKKRDAVTAINDHLKTTTTTNTTTKE